MTPSAPLSPPTNGSKTRPFPWRCAKCRRKEVEPAILDYQCEVAYEGSLHTIPVSDLRVPKCRNCGELAFGNESSDQISDATRRHLGLLTAEQIRQGRETLGLSVPEIDRLLGLGPDSLADYENSLKIQSRVLDRYLRAFFAVPQLRAVLSDTAREPQFGNLVVV